MNSQMLHTLTDSTAAEVWILLGTLAWKSCVILGIAILATFLLRRASATSRHLIWTSAMFGLLLLPVLQWVLPQASFAVLPENASVHLERTSTPAHGQPTTTAPLAGESVRPISPIATEDADFLTVGSTEWGPPNMATISSEAASQQPQPPSWPWLFMIWTAGAMIVMVPTLIAFFAAARRGGSKSSRFPLPTDRLLSQLAIRRPVRFVTDKSGSMPMVAGLLRCTVMLPSDAVHWPADKLRSVLLHELAHVKRCDPGTQILARLALAIFWFNPLAWYANRRMLIERERACDDLVLQSGVDPSGYADTLLDIARGHTTLGLARLAVPMMARPSQLEGRLRSILDNEKPRGQMTRQRLSMAAALALLGLLPIAALHLTSPTALAGESHAQDTESPTGLSASAQTGAVLHVARDGGGEFTTIQAAVDAAAPGSTIQIAAGNYEERIVIKQHLKLVGAGPEQTRVLGPVEESFALRIQGAQKVRIQGIRFAASGAHDDESLLPGGIVEISNSEAELVDCAIANGPANGITIDGSSQVAITNSFVGAVWSEGIHISDTAAVQITGCEIRNAYHYGILIRSKGKVLVQGCRISGAQWHAVRYDHCSPTVRGNLFFNNKRTGIYANGKTNAKVSGNVFYNTGFSGMSAWDGNRDRISSNTFIGNDRAGIEVLGSANPAIEDNLFIDHAVGIASGNPMDESKFVDGLAGVVLKNNVFWQNPVMCRLAGVPDMSKAAALDAQLEGLGNLHRSPLSIEAIQLSIPLSLEDTSKTADTWACSKPTLQKPWASSFEEKPFKSQLKVPAGPQVASEEHSARSPLQKGENWIADIMQIENPDLRTHAIQDMREAMGSADEAVRAAALRAFLGTHQVDYDRSSFRKLILPYLASTDGRVLSNTFSALFSIGRQPEDLEQLLRAARKKIPGLHESIARHLSNYSNKNIQGEAAQVLLELLQTEDKKELRQLYTSLWGVRLTPALQARLAVLAQHKNRNFRSDLLYYVISTSPEKTDAYLDILFKAATGSNYEMSDRALWGLGYGIGEQQHKRVADFAIKLLAARTSAPLVKDIMKLVKLYAQAEHAPAIKELAANQMRPAKLREQLLAIVKDLATK